MRPLSFAALAALSGCLVSHRMDTIPTPYDHVPTDPTTSREVKACTFELFNFLPVSGPRGHKNRRHHMSDVTVSLQQQGPHAHVMAETVTRTWLILGRSDCTYASGQPVPVEDLINPK